MTVYLKLTNYAYLPNPYMLSHYTVVAMSAPSTDGIGHLSLEPRQK